MAEPLNPMMAIVNGIEDLSEHEKQVDALTREANAYLAMLPHPEKHRLGDDMTYWVPVMGSNCSVRAAWEVIFKLRRAGWYARFERDKPLKGQPENKNFCWLVVGLLAGDTPQPDRSP